MNKRNNLLLIIALLIAAVFTRFIPHLGNFTAVIAVSLLGGAWVKRRELAIIIPLAAVFLSDLVINNTLYATGSFQWFYPGMIYPYLSYAIIALVASFGLKGKSSNGLKLAGYGIGGSVFFFLFTNFGAWLGNPMYAQDISGLIASYTAGIPFFGRTLLGTLAYGSILVMSKVSIESYIRSLKAA